ncbi:PepSY-associated TM helix domain-containing protein [Pararcticibacter amylolyticus]|uniref:PepSY domain-containing protein n=1 Tax=Pararcticibacter amylolyticus TaxID=2173175 RepID=A0A2U2PF20_9SPHI|nr:PepSY-associated TM helix domain-containing protein [Pararcticibacter amylolyticus]PWG79924.1 PepSY domain-containing protein [Pararcticibacter amylolyticus]
MRIRRKPNDAPPKKGSKSAFGKFIAWIHLWPSLISAIILIVVCLTGTIIVYCDEIINFANRDVLYVQHVKKEKLPVETLIAGFRKEYPERRNPGYMVTYRDPARTVKFNSFDKKKGLRLVYMDPYTGRILKDDGTIYFFYITAHLHNSLLWHGTGEWIIDIATIIFLVELITGLILWWPAKWTKTTREQSFRIKWKARFRRLNYDLHNVLGFYSLTVVAILTITGLIIAFKPLAGFTVSSFGGDPSHAWEKKLPAFKREKQPQDLYRIIDRAFADQPWAQEARVSTYTLDSAGYYMFSLTRMAGLKSQDGNFPVFADRYTGATLNIPEGAILHENIENTYWSLHMGTWMGWFGKLVTFTGGLIATSLPITGFYIWWGRRNKKKRPQRLGKSNSAERTITPQNHAVN